MRAVVLEKTGEPADVLVLRDVPVPQPQSDEVRVRMLASPINPSDLLMIRGRYGKQPKLPATPGFEGVGIVESSGGGLLGKMLVGKRVAVLNRATGNWCDQTVLPAKQAIPLPDDLPLEQAAMFFVNPATAYAMTRHVLRVPAGQWLLQTAAGSALGRMVIRLGKRFGFRTLNVVRREDAVDELKRLGDDAVVVFDPDRHPPQHLRDEVRNATGGDGVKFAIDPVGGRTASAAVDCLADGGRLLLYGTLTEEPLSFSPRALMMTGARVEGFWLAPWMQQKGLIGKLRLVGTIKRLMREGVLVSDIAQTFPLEQITEAVRAAEQPARGGKVLLRIAER